MQKDTNKGYIALLGWSLNAIEAAENFDRRYIVHTPTGPRSTARNMISPTFPGILSVSMITPSKLLKR